MGRAASASAMLMKMSHSVCFPPQTRCQRAAPLLHASSSIAGKGMAEAGRCASSTARPTYLSTLCFIRARFLHGKHKTPDCKRGQAGAGGQGKARRVVGIGRGCKDRPYEGRPACRHLCWKEPAQGQGRWRRTSAPPSPRLRACTSPLLLRLTCSRKSRASIPRCATCSLPYSHT